MTGRWFDEWNVGDRIDHPIRRTVTETDNLLLTALTHNPQPLHLDAEYAAGTEFGRIVVNGTFTFALMSAFRSARQLWGPWSPTSGTNTSSCPSRCSSATHYGCFQR